ncbi:DUF4224 domain-containing protein [Cupriavidus sp. a3]|uniref:DUF4224 domain-containing protein n=1 Tax=Cupriavidus sp. a3 TaxID=3242158 RepID=UPI003D9C5322
MTTLTLSGDEVRELTNRQKPSAQIRALRAMGIEHKVRPDGTVAVLRSHVDAQMGGPRERRAASPDWQPNWSAA